MKRFEEKRVLDQDFAGLEIKLELTDGEQADVDRQFSDKLEARKLENNEKDVSLMKGKSPWKYYAAVAGAAVIMLLLLVPVLTDFGQSGSGSGIGGEQTGDTLLFGDINDLEDFEFAFFNWYDEPNVSSGSSQLAPDDERLKELVSEIRTMDVEQMKTEEYEPDFARPDSYLVNMVHDEAMNISTAVTVNEEGTVHIFEHATMDGPADIYRSEGKVDFFEKMKGIVLEERDKETSWHNDDSAIDEVAFEYKDEAETVDGAEVLEIRSEDGRLIADLSDIEPGSAQIREQETGAVVTFRFVQNGFVYAFTSNHIGETVPFYFKGEMITAPKVNMSIQTEEIMISGELDDELMEEIVDVINVTR
ncbi:MULTISPECIES: hypothetical protein [Bacillaceae]|uniref:DUF4367 domain-containing protein n=1 Tax=Evansella alkalicola TaxID=745819 RepID=A0ABS6JXS9_9BACI|nr:MULTISPECIES: hypothetical protein [Bacillaceae]MBU9723396.1 hypothetical protein [Bacillus alkalicola]